MNFNIYLLLHKNSKMNQRNNKLINIVSDNRTVIVIITFFVLYNLQAFINHYFFRTNALDYGFHLQAFWKFTSFKSGPITIFDTPLKSYYQIHPSFTLAIITPLAWLLKPIFGTYTLLLIQNIFFTIGGYFTFKVVLFKSNNKLVSLLAAIHYFVLWGHFSAIAFEYIDANIAATTLPLFIFLFYKKRFWSALLVFVFIISSRENMPLWFIFIGLFLFIENFKNPKIRIWSSIYVFISFFYLIFVFKILIPFFHEEGYVYSRFQYSSLGENIPEATRFIFTHPIESIKLLFINHLGNEVFNGIKLEFWYVFLLSGGIFLLRKPLFFLIFVPIIGQKLYSNDYQMWGINIFYSIEIVSVLSIAAYLSIANIKSTKKVKYLAVSLCIATCLTTVIKMNTRDSKWYVKSKEKIYDPAFYKANHDICSVKDILKLIPTNASVCANEKLVPHLAFRDKIYYYPHLNDSEYLVFLLNSSTYPLNKDEFETHLKNIEESSEWEVVKKTKDVILFQKSSAI